MCFLKMQRNKKEGVCHPSFFKARVSMIWNTSALSETTFLIVFYTFIHRVVLASKLDRVSGSPEEHKRIF